MTALLSIEELSVAFTQYERGLRRREVIALDGMSLDVDAGQVVALVGASGAGKSLLAHAVLGLLPPNATERGTVRYAGEAVDVATRRRLAGKDLALLPQAVSYLDPVAPVGRQVRRSARLAGCPRPAHAAREALAAQRLDAGVWRRYPHQLSGGMARRVLVAMTMLSRPRLVLADEPTPGLPAAQSRAILAEFRSMADRGTGVLLITHELAGALQVADRVVICDAGRTVDVASPEQFTGSGDRLTHRYTRALWRALPGNGFLLPDEELSC